MNIDKLEFKDMGSYYKSQKLNHVIHGEIYITIWKISDPVITIYKKNRMRLENSNILYKFINFELAAKKCEEVLESMGFTFKQKESTNIIDDEDAFANG